MGNVSRYPLSHRAAEFAKLKRTAPNFSYEIGIDWTLWILSRSQNH